MRRNIWLVKPLKEWLAYRKFNASMIGVGIFIMLIFVGVEIFAFLYAPKPLTLLLFLIAFPKKQIEEVWEDMRIFIDNYQS